MKSSMMRVFLLWRMLRSARSMNDLDEPDYEMRAKLLQNYKFTQFGAPRTGTTFQHVLLQAARCILNNGTLPRSQVHQIAKYHTRNHEPFSSSEENVIYFTTAAVGMRMSASVIRNNSYWKVLQKELKTNNGNDVVFVQILERLRTLGHIVAYDYQPILNLTNHETDMLAAFMKYWSLLRRCCGAQMSKHYRARLWSLNTVQSPPIDPMLVSDPGYDDCEIYNIERIELELMSTAVTTLCFPQNKVELAHRLDSVDGHYCALANYATQSLRLSFNDKLYARLTNNFNATSVNTAPEYRPVWEKS